MTPVRKYKRKGNVKSPSNTESHIANESLDGLPGAWYPVLHLKLLVLLILQYQHFEFITYSSYCYCWSIIFSSTISFQLVRSCRHWCMPQILYQTLAEMYVVFYFVWSYKVLTLLQAGLAVLHQGSNTYAECLQYYKQMLSKKNSKHVRSFLFSLA